MINPSSAPRATAIEAAAQAIVLAKLQVFALDWRSAEHRPDLVATPDDSILGAVEVRVVAHGTLDACITAISVRIRQLAGAAREWMRRHGAAVDLAVTVAVLTADCAVPAHALAGGLYYCRAQHRRVTGAGARLAAGRCDELLRRFMPVGGGWEPTERAIDMGLVSDFAAADSLRVAWTFTDVNGHSGPTLGGCTAALGLRMGEVR